jgi:SAM-dependent methyltransferase
MARRCLVATAVAQLPTSIDDGLLGTQRRRLLHRATGRVLDASALWGSNLSAYQPAAVASLAVTGAGGRVGRDPLVPVPQILPALADAPVAAFDTVVLAFTLCAVEQPVQLLTEAAARLAPGGQLLVLQHVAGTGLTGLLQQWTKPMVRAVKTVCRFDVDVPVLARRAGLALIDCDRFRIWVATSVPAPGLAGVLVPTPRGA